MKNLYITLKDGKEFRYLWLGYTLTVFGEWFAIIAVNLYVWNAYESMILSSINIAVSMIPTVFLGPLLGGAVDRISKKKLAILLSVFNCVILVIPVLFRNIYAVCLFNFLIGVVSCIRYPWINSYIPELVEKKDLINANSLISFSKTSGQLIMPLLSGILMATGSSFVLYLLNIGFLILAIICFFRLSCMKTDGKMNIKEREPGLHLSAVKGIFTNTAALTVSLTIMSLLFLDGAIELLLIVETQTVPEQADFYYGMVTTIKGLGMTLASAGVCKWLSGTEKDAIRLLCLCSYLKVLFIFLMGQVSHMYLFIVIVFLEAYLWISITIIEKLIMQSVFPCLDRAKIFAVYGSMCWLASSVGTLCFGFLAEKISISKAVMAEAILVGIVLFVIHKKTLRRRAG